MRIISFAWTTPAVKAKVKFCTRRDWYDDYAKTFKAGQHLMGYDRNPRAGGKPFQEIVLTMAPYKEPYWCAPESDCDEGFDYLEGIGATVHGMTPRAIWKQDQTEIWVVRFEYG